MNIFYSLISLICLTALSPFTVAQDIQGQSFSYRDWEVHCSNTGTCRAAGYQPDSVQMMPASNIADASGRGKNRQSRQKLPYPVMIRL